jgi:hypothetical protein
VRPSRDREIEGLHWVVETRTVTFALNRLVRRLGNDCRRRVARHGARVNSSSLMHLEAGGPFGEADMGWARNLDILLDRKA